MMSISISLEDQENLKEYLILNNVEPTKAIILMTGMVIQLLRSGGVTKDGFIEIIEECWEETNNLDDHHFE